MVGPSIAGGGDGELAVRGVDRGELLDGADAEERELLDLALAQVMQRVGAERPMTPTKTSVYVSIHGGEFSTVERCDRVVDSDKL